MLPQFDASEDHRVLVGYGTSRPGHLLCRPSVSKPGRTGLETALGRSKRLEDAYRRTSTWSNRQAQAAMLTRTEHTDVVYEPPPGLDGLAYLFG